MRLTEKNSMIISIGAEKAFDEIKLIYMIKKKQQQVANQKTEGNFPQPRSPKNLELTY